MPLRQQSPEVNTVESWELKTASINTFTVPVIAPERKKRLSVIGNTVSSMNFDIIGFQELFYKSDRDKLFNSSKFKFEKYLSVSRTGGSGNYILSNHELMNERFWYHLLLGKINDAEFWSGKGIAKSSFQKDGILVSFFNVHLLSRTTEDGALLLTEIV